MKRMTLNIDLEENQAFDKETENIIKAKVNETVRNNLDGWIEEEAKKGIERLFKKSQYDYSNRIENMAYSEVKSFIGDKINSRTADYHLSELAKERAQKFMDENEDVLVKKMSENLKDKCNEILEKIINEKVQAKLKEILG